MMWLLGLALYLAVVVVILRFVHVATKGDGPSDIPLRASVCPGEQRKGRS